jgi:Tfp pilus assembly protein PilP
MPLISEARRQSQVDLCEFKASLVYRVSSRTARTSWRDPVSKQTNKQTNKQMKNEKRKPSMVLPSSKLEYYKTDLPCKMLSLMY